MADRVILGVTGSIAAFKAAALASLMVQSGLEVRAILTAGGARFVSPLTFEALTGRPAGTEIWEEQPGSSRMGHLELARWADLLVVAPASASSIARLRLGLADDLLGAVALATPATVLLAPAMESHMYAHPATQEHLAALIARGVHVVGPVSGRLASGAEGAGRMVEPEAILEAVLRALKRAADLSGYTVLVTAGPTYEPIDPVRFIGNRSSGKMGYAIAEIAAARGARVDLISGPTGLADPRGVQTTRVETADEMLRAVLDRVADADVVVMAAAIGDFRPDEVATDKLKRSEGTILRLSPTSDVAAAAAAAAPRAIHVGFALETSDLSGRARQKLERKGQRLVVANAVTEDHTPFGSDTNRVILVFPDREVPLPEMSKRALAERLWDEIVPMLRSEGSADEHGADQVPAGPGELLPRLDEIVPHSPPLADHE